jgi:hypothetical protein
MTASIRLTNNSIRKVHSTDKTFTIVRLDCEIQILAPPPLWRCDGRRICSRTYLTGEIVAPVGRRLADSFMAAYRHFFVWRYRVIPDTPAACSALRACVVRAANVCASSSLHRKAAALFYGRLLDGGQILVTRRYDGTRLQADGDAGRCGQQPGRSLSRVAGGEHSFQAKRRLWRVDPWPESATRLQLPRQFRQPNMFLNIFFVHHNSTAAAEHGSDFRNPGERS